MSSIRSALFPSLIASMLVACASLEEPEAELDPPPQTRVLNMGVVTNIPGALAPPSVGSSSGGIGWELTVDPGVIRSGELFVAELEATAIFAESLLNQGQLLFAESGGFTSLLVRDLQATVRVRKGAQGDPIILKPEAIPLTIEIPTSRECAAGGTCERLGHTGDGSQCEANEFCVTGPVEVKLTGGPGVYRADSSGTVRFGFDDQPENTGFNIRREGDCNDGTYFRDPPAFEDPVGSNGARILVEGLPVAFEFIMAEDSRLDYGIDSCDASTSPTPDANLIKFPIQQP